eukprot:756498-Hanusia_phi.AAC.5
MTNTSPEDEGELDGAVSMSVLRDHDEEVRGGGGYEGVMESLAAVILELCNSVKNTSEAQGQSSSPVVSQRRIHCRCQKEEINCFDIDSLVRFRNVILR